MPTSRVTVAASWGATPDLTATADTAVLIRNTENKNLFFWITESDVAPVVPEGQGHLVRPAWSSESNIALALKPGERLWLAMPTGPANITITTGQA